MRKHSLLTDENINDFHYTPVFQVPSLPVIDWDKYTSNLDFSNIALHRHMTRLKRQLVDETGGEVL